jgi:hypothetical protein
MIIRKTLCFAAGFAALFATAAYAQNAKEPNTVIDYCLKAAPGKYGEAAAFVQDDIVHFDQARANAGAFAWAAIMSGVVPLGQSAPCDFRLVYGYHGFFPDSEGDLQAELKRGGVNTDLKEFFAKEDSLVPLKNLEYWVNVDGTGTGMQPGYFIRLNHYNVRPNEGAEWSRLETTYWKPLVDDWIKAGNKGDWAAYRLWMPNGDNQAYNAMTVDIFPNWNSMAHGLPLDDLWPKLHPHTDMTEVFDQLERARSRYNTEIYRIINIVQRKNAQSK